MCLVKQRFASQKGKRNKGLVTNHNLLIKGNLNFKLRAVQSSENFLIESKQVESVQIDMLVMCEFASNSFI